MNPFFQFKMKFDFLVIKYLHKFLKPVKDQVVIIHTDDSSVTVLMSRLSVILLSPRKLKIIQM